jgi:threonine/homoserine/homoserine lactone efflux protein
LAAEITYLLSGAALGASAGLSPGPLQALVISETLQHGRREGMKVSFAPLLTDFPIILLAVFLLSKMADFGAVMGLISICGALFVFRLAFLNLKTAGRLEDSAIAAPASLKRAAVTNFLNPHPYMFWVFVGAPTVLGAADKGTLGAAAFLLGFYTVLVGIFILLATGAAAARQWMRGRAYRWVMRGLGAVLALFALFLFYRGLNFFAIL